MDRALDFDTNTVEQLTLRQLVLDRRWLSLVSSEYDKRWFETPVVSQLIDFCVKFHRKYGDVTITRDLLQMFAKKLMSSKTITVSPAEANMVIDNAMRSGEHIDQDVSVKNILTYIQQRAMWCAVSDNADDIENNVEGALERCMARFDKISKMSILENDIGMDYFSSCDMDKHWDAIKNPEAKISTGWESMDKYTYGGFLRNGRSLYVFMGQAGLGKSLFLSNLTVNFLRQKLKVAVISLEMSQDLYAQRFDAHISGLNINRLKENADAARERIEAFQKKYPGAKLFIKEYPPRTIRISDIELYLDNLIAQGDKPDVLIVDYLNLVLPKTRSENMYADIQGVSENMRALSYKYQIPVVTATQANRQGMNNENISMEHVSESAGIAHTVDFLAGLYQMPEDREAGIIKARILKNRLGGAVGQVITFEMNKENLTLSDISSQNTINVPNKPTNSIDVYAAIPGMAKEINKSKTAKRQSDDFLDAFDDEDGGLST